MARNGDGLFRRRGIWYFKYKGADGQYREKSTGKRRQPDAREYRLDFLDKLRRHQLPTEEAKWTLSQALDRYLEFRAKTRARASVAAEQTAARHLSSVIGPNRRLESISIWDVRRFQMRRSETVGPKTVNNELLVLTAVLKTARLWAQLKEDYVPLPVPKHGPGQSLSPEQTAHLIETARSMIDGLLHSAQRCLPMRRGAAPARSRPCSSATCIWTRNIPTSGFGRR